MSREGICFQCNPTISLVLGSFSPPAVSFHRPPPKPLPLGLSPSIPTMKTIQISMKPNIFVQTKDEAGEGPGGGGGTEGQGGQGLGGLGVRVRIGGEAVAEINEGGEGGHRGPGGAKGRGQGGQGRVGRPKRGQAGGPSKGSAAGVSGGGQGGPGGGGARGGQRATGGSGEEVPKTLFGLWKGTPQQNTTEGFCHRL